MNVYCYYFNFSSAFIFIKITHAHNFKSEIVLQGLLLKTATPDQPYLSPAPQILPTLLVNYFSINLNNF